MRSVGVATGLRRLPELGGAGHGVMSRVARNIRRTSKGSIYAFCYDDPESTKANRYRLFDTKRLSRVPPLQNHCRAARSAIRQAAGSHGRRRRNCDRLRSRLHHWGHLVHNVDHADAVAIGGHVELKLDRYAVRSCCPTLGQRARLLGNTGGAEILSTLLDPIRLPLEEASNPLRPTCTRQRRRRGPAVSPD